MWDTSGAEEDLYRKNRDQRMLPTTEEHFSQIGKELAQGDFRRNKQVSCKQHQQQYAALCNASDLKMQVLVNLLRVANSRHCFVENADVQPPGQYLLLSASLYTCLQLLMCSIEGLVKRPGGLVFMHPPMDLATPQPHSSPLCCAAAVCKCKCPKRSGPTVPLQSSAHAAAQECGNLGAYHTDGQSWRASGDCLC